MLLKEIRGVKPLTKEQEYNLWQQMKEGDNEARSNLIRHNKLYVVKRAKDFQGSKATLEDLIQAGCEGLVRAVNNFDASLGFRLISYATWSIENEVRKAAYDYIRHDHSSLDAPLYEDDKEGETLVDRLVAKPYQSADWNLRYRDALESLKRQAEERQYGLGHLTAELHQMLLDGYTTSDFARRHRLSEQQMTRLLTTLREEAGLSLRDAA
jgi:RNA polymerase sigma factor (sigma-70 family)